MVNKLTIMNSRKSFLLRLVTNIILLGLSLTCIIFLWNKVEGVNTLYMMLSFLISYIIFYSIVYSNTLTQKEMDAQQGDFMCDC